MRKIDNLGSGSCLYYSYSISLMHYLKSLSAENRSICLDSIWDVLVEPKNPDELEQLKHIIQNKSPIFSSQEITEIQKILAQKFRQTLTEKQISQGEDVHKTIIKMYLEDKASLKNYNEISRVPGIRKILSQFNGENLEETYTAFKAASIRRLNNPKTWGTHEQLVELNNIIFSGTEQKPKLKITKYGKHSEGSEAIADIIIDNVNLGRHWVSQIPSYIDFKIKYPHGRENVIDEIANHFTQYLEDSTLKALNNAETTSRHKLAQATFDLHNKLLSSLFASEDPTQLCYESNLLKKLNVTLSVITNPEKNKMEKIQALSDFESLAKSNSSKFKALRFLLGCFISMAVSAVFGVIVGSLAINPAGGLVLASVAALTSLSTYHLGFGVKGIKSYYTHVFGLFRENKTDKFIAVAKSALKEEPSKDSEESPQGPTI